jgi:hypothetical protein
MGIFSWFWKGQETTLDADSPEAVIKQIKRYDRLSRSMLHKATKYERETQLRKAYLDDALECEKIISELKKFLQINPDTILYDDGEDELIDDDPLYIIIQQMRARQQASNIIDTGVLGSRKTSGSMDTIHEDISG